MGKEDVIICQSGMQLIDDDDALAGWLAGSPELKFRYPLTTVSR